MNASTLISLTILGAVLLYTHSFGEAQCYGFNPDDGFDKLLRLTTPPISDDSQFHPIECKYGATLEQGDTITETKAKCTSGTLTLWNIIDESTNAEITDPPKFPTCPVGTVDCSNLPSAGTIAIDFGAFPVDNTKQPWYSGSSSCPGSWTGNSFAFSAKDCAPVFGTDTDESGDTLITVQHMIQPQITGSTVDSSTVYHDPSIIITTTCKIPETDTTTVLAWKSADSDVSEQHSGTADIEFTFAMVSSSGVLDTSNRYVVVIGEDIAFSISWDYANDAGMEFQLKSLDVKMQSPATTTINIVTDGCTTLDSSKFNPTDTAIGDDAYEFTLKSFSLDDDSSDFDLNGAEFNLEATVQLCEATSCTALTCAGGETPVNTDGGRKRSADLFNNREEVQLSTGPFVLMSKEQVSGVKAVGWMLPLSIFSILFFLKYV